MHNFAPDNYVCPICLTLSGIESDQTMAKQADIIYRDSLVMAMVNSKFIPGNEGHLIVVPVDHYENIHDLPNNILSRIARLSKYLAGVIMQAYGCDGIMLQQNNGPASGQHAFHYHQHIIPRYDSDKFFTKKAYVADPVDRLPYVRKMKKYLTQNPFRPE